MSKNISRLILLVGGGLILGSIVILNLYMFFIKDTSQSYSITRSWKSYYGLENWNMPNNAHVDIDGDGVRDGITYEGCAVLSTMSETNIAPHQQCNKPDDTPRAYAGEGNENRIGTEISKLRGYNFLWPTQSFFVRTDDDRWRYYEYRGLQINVIELESDGKFAQKPASVLDYIDALYFQLTHLFTLPLHLVSWVMFMLQR